MTRSAFMRSACALLAAVAAFAVAYLASTLCLVWFTPPTLTGVNAAAVITAQVSWCLLGAVCVGRLVITSADRARS
jgi:hypothetical protein